MITYYVYTYAYCPKPRRENARSSDPALSAIANHDPPATRNRDRARPRTKTILCRMHGCNHIESQLHIVKCKKLRPYWNLVARIQLHHHSPRRTIPPRTQSPPCAIIFNMKTRDSLLPEPTCALLRHAFGCFYDAFSQIDLATEPSSPPSSSTKPS